MCKWVFSLLLALSLSLPAGAIQSAVSEQDFIQDQHLYVFANVEGAEQAMSATLRLEAYPEYAGDAQARRLDQADVPVSYFFLLDASNSMNKAKSAVRQFARGLARADASGARYSLATIDAEFKVILEDTTRINTFLNKLDSLNLTVMKSDLAQGILDAVDHLESRQRLPGELVNLVIITDSVPQRADGTVEMEQAADRVNQSTCILTHTFGLDTGLKEAQQGLEMLASMGGGLHDAMKWDEKGAAEKGMAVAEFVNSLYAIDFQLFDLELEPPVNGDVSIRPEEEGESFGMILRQIPVLGAVLPGESIPGIEEPSTEEQEPPDSPEEAPAPGSPEMEEPSDPETPTEPETPQPSDSAPDVEEADVPNVEDSGEKEIPGWIIPALAAAGVIAALIVCAVLLRRRGGAKAEPSPDSIPMRLEVVSGSCPSDGQTIYLNGELWIGSGRGCDVVFRDKAVSAKNSRIFRSGGLIYIEDLGSQSGTALSGMRLHQPNRLRSGDEISIGPVCFHLLF